MRKFLKSLLAAAFLPAAAAGAEPAPVNADPALWVVKDADTTIYLFGTIHALRKGVNWFDGGVKKAYDASSEVVLEIVEPEPAEAQSLVMQKAVDPNGTPLTQKLTPDSAKAYTAAMQTVGLPAPAFEKFEPWFAATMLAVSSVVKSGYEPQSGIEKQLTAAAARDGKTLGELESLNEQLDLFDTMPEKDQIAFLNSTVSELPESTPMLDAMVARWARGDPDGLAALLNKSMSMTPELTKKLLTDRNAKWANWIQQRLDQPGTVFVAVGAGHLAGANSVQAFLRAKKIEAQRIPS